MDLLLLVILVRSTGDSLLRLLRTIRLASSYSTVQLVPTSPSDILVLVDSRYLSMVAQESILSGLQRSRSNSRVLHTAVFPRSLLEKEEFLRSLEKTSAEHLHTKAKVNYLVLAVLSKASVSIQTRSRCSSPSLETQANRSYQTGMVLLVQKSLVLQNQSSEHLVIRQKEVCLQSVAAQKEELITTTILLSTSIRRETIKVFLLLVRLPTLQPVKFLLELLQLQSFRLDLLEQVLLQQFKIHSPSILLLVLLLQAVSIVDLSQARTTKELSEKTTDLLPTLLLYSAKYPNIHSEKFPILPATSDKSRQTSVCCTLVLDLYSLLYLLPADLHQYTLVLEDYLDLVEHPSLLEQYHQQRHLLTSLLEQQTRSLLLDTLVMSISGSLVQQARERQPILSDRSMSKSGVERSTDMHQTGMVLVYYSLSEQVPKRSQSTFQRSRQIWYSREPLESDPLSSSPLLYIPNYLVLQSRDRQTTMSVKQIFVYSTSLLYQLLLCLTLAKVASSHSVEQQNPLLQIQKRRLHYSLQLVQQMYELLVQNPSLQTSNYLEQLHQKSLHLQSNHLVQYLYLEQHLTESSMFTLAKVLYSVSVKVQRQSQSESLHSRQIWNSRVLLLRDAHLVATLDSEIYLFLEQLHQNYLHLQSNQKYKSKYLELQKLQELVLTLSKVLSSQLDSPTKQSPENYLHSR